MDVQLHADLKCSECNQFLSRSPVYLKPDGSSVCHRCVCPTLELTRNKSYEAAARLLKFPCEYHTHGCKESVGFVSEDDETVHENCCQFRQFPCLLMGGNCNWTGTRQEFIEHCQYCHRERCLMNPSKMSLDLNKTGDYNFIINDFDVSFLLQVKVCDSTGKIYHGVRCLDDNKVATNFYFTLQVKKGSSVILKEGDVMSQGPLILEESTCIVLSTNTLRDLFDGLKRIWFTVTIKEKDDGFCGKATNLNPLLCSRNSRNEIIDNENDSSVEFQDENDSKDDDCSCDECKADLLDQQNRNNGQNKNSEENCSNEIPINLNNDEIPMNLNNETLTICEQLNCFENKLDTKINPSEHSPNLKKFDPVNCKICIANKNEFNESQNVTVNVIVENIPPETFVEDNIVLTVEQPEKPLAKTVKFCENICKIEECQYDENIQLDFTETHKSSDAKSTVDDNEYTEDNIIDLISIDSTYIIQMKLKKLISNQIADQIKLVNSIQENNKMEEKGVAEIIQIDRTNNIIKLKLQKLISNEIADQIKLVESILSTNNQNDSQSIVELKKIDSRNHIIILKLQKPISDDIMKQLLLVKSIFEGNIPPDIVEYCKNIDYMSNEQKMIKKERQKGGVNRNEKTDQESENRTNSVPPNDQKVTKIHPRLVHDPVIPGSSFELRVTNFENFINHNPDINNKSIVDSINVTDQNDETIFPAQFLDKKRINNTSGVLYKNNNFRSSDVESETSSTPSSSRIKNTSTETKQGHGKGNNNKDVSNMQNDNGEENNMQDVENRNGNSKKGKRKHSIENLTEEDFLDVNQNRKRSKINELVQVPNNTNNNNEKYTTGNGKKSLDENDVNYQENEDHRNEKMKSQLRRCTESVKNYHNTLSSDEKKSFKYHELMEKLYNMSNRPKSESSSRRESTKSDKVMNPNKNDKDLIDKKNNGKHRPQSENARRKSSLNKEMKNEYTPNHKSTTDEENSQDINKVVVENMNKEKMILSSDTNIENHNKIVLDNKEKIDRNKPRSVDTKKRYSTEDEIEEISNNLIHIKRLSSETKAEEDKVGRKNGSNSVDDKAKRSIKKSIDEEKIHDQVVVEDTNKEKMSLPPDTNKEQQQRNHERTASNNEPRSVDSKTRYSTEDEIELSNNLKHVRRFIVKNKAEKEDNVGRKNGSKSVDDRRRRSIKKSIIDGEKNLDEKIDDQHIDKVVVENTNREKMSSSPDTNTEQQQIHHDKTVSDGERNKSRSVDSKKRYSTEDEIEFSNSLIHVRRISSGSEAEKEDNVGRKDGSKSVDDGRRRSIKKSIIDEEKRLNEKVIDTVVVENTNKEKIGLSPHANTKQHQRRDDKTVSENEESIERNNPKSGDTKKRYSTKDEIGEADNLIQVKKLTLETGAKNENKVDTKKLHSTENEIEEIGNNLIQVRRLSSETEAEKEDNVGQESRSKSVDGRRRHSTKNGAEHSHQEKEKNKTDFKNETKKGSVKEKIKISKNHEQDLGERHLKKLVAIDKNKGSSKKNSIKPEDNRQIQTLDPKFEDSAVNSNGRYSRRCSLKKTNHNNRMNETVKRFKTGEEFANNGRRTSMKNEFIQTEDRCFNATHSCCKMLQKILLQTEVNRKNHLQLLTNERRRSSNQNDHDFEQTLAKLLDNQTQTTREKKNKNSEQNGKILESTDRTERLLTKTGTHQIDENKTSSSKMNSRQLTDEQILKILDENHITDKDQQKSFIDKCKRLCFKRTYKESFITTPQNIEDNNSKLEEIVIDNNGTKSKTIDTEQIKLDYENQQQPKTEETGDRQQSNEEATIDEDRSKKCCKKPYNYELLNRLLQINGYKHSINSDLQAIIDQKNLTIDEFRMLLKNETKCCKKSAKKGLNYEKRKLCKKCCKYRPNTESMTKNYQTKVGKTRCTKKIQCTQESLNQHEQLFIMPSSCLKCVKIVQVPSQPNISTVQNICKCNVPKENVRDSIDKDVQVEIDEKPISKNQNTQVQLMEELKNKRKQSKSEGTQIELSQKSSNKNAETQFESIDQFSSEVEFNQKPVNKNTETQVESIYQSSWSQDEESYQKEDDEIKDNLEEEVVGDSDSVFDTSIRREENINRYEEQTATQDCQQDCKPCKQKYRLYSYTREVRGLKYSCDSNENQCNNCNNHYFVQTPVGTVLYWYSQKYGKFLVNLYTALPDEELQDVSFNIKCDNIDFLVCGCDINIYKIKNTKVLAEL